MKDRIVYLVRHGEPIIVNGVKEGLSPKGVNQALRVVKQLQAKPNMSSGVVIGFSPVLRCRETADCIAEKLHATCEAMPLRLANADRLIVREYQSKYKEYLRSHARFGIESPDMYGERIYSYLNELPGSGPIILIANEVPIRLLLQYLKKTSYTNTITHGSVVELSVRSKSQDEMSTL